MGFRHKNSRKWYALLPWGKAGMGRYHKRILSKARRAYAKQLIKQDRGKEPTGFESTVNYRGY